MLGQTCLPDPATQWEKWTEMHLPEPEPWCPECGHLQSDAVGQNQEGLYCVYCGSKVEEVQP